PAPRVRLRARRAALEGAARRAARRRPDAAAPRRRPGAPRARAATGRTRARHAARRLGGGAGAAPAPFLGHTGMWRSGLELGRLRLGELWALARRALPRPCSAAPSRARSAAARCGSDPARPERPPCCSCSRSSAERSTSARVHVFRALPVLDRFGRHPAGLVEPRESRDRAVHGGQIATPPANTLGRRSTKHLGLPSSLVSLYDHSAPGLGRSARWGAR